MTALKRTFLFLLAFALILAASGCGPSVEETYFTNLTPAIEEYNAALAGVGTQFEGISNDALNDQAWMDATFAALDRLDAAGQALARTATAPPERSGAASDRPEPGSRPAAWHRDRTAGPGGG